jgi:hypothetical protein
MPFPGMVVADRAAPGHERSGDDASHLAPLSSQGYPSTAGLPESSFVDDREWLERGRAGNLARPAEIRPGPESAFSTSRR